MALILGVHRGDRFYLDDEPVRVLSFEGYSRAVLEIDGREIEVTDLKATEVCRGVYISCGVPLKAREGEPTIPRLVIDAPREVIVLREELYGKPKPTRVSHPA